jgi:hypothetical protein
MDYENLFKDDIEVPMDIIYDLSIVEVISILFLLIHRRDVVRYSLYLEVKNFFDVSISTSSFYNSLNNLEKKGLLSFVKTAKGKIKYINPTEISYPAVCTILKNIFYLRMADYPPSYYEMFDLILKELGKTHFRNTLTVWFDDFIDLDLVAEISNISDEMFVLSKEKTFDEVGNLDITNLRKTTIFNGKIREPNDFFEVCAIPYYKKKVEFGNTSRASLLKEVFRVIKKEEYIVLLARKKLPEVEGHYGEHILCLFNQAIERNIFIKEEIQNDLIQAGFSDIKIMEEKGLFIAIGKKT